MAHDHHGGGVTPVVFEDEPQRLWAHLETIARFTSLEPFARNGGHA